MGTERQEEVFFEVPLPSGIFVIKVGTKGCASFTYAVQGQAAGL